MMRLTVITHIMPTAAATAARTHADHHSEPRALSEITLKPSVKIRCASLNSGVEKERRGSSFFLISSNCKWWDCVRVHSGRAVVDAES